MNRPAILGAVLGAFAILPLVFAQADKADAAAGKKVFEGRCIECHNADSKDEKVGPGLKGIKDGVLPSGKKATHDNIHEVVEEGVGDEMPAFGDVLSAKEKEDVVAYVLTL
jgi:mono/diheme cytochrome c family protein